MAFDDLPGDPPKELPGDPAWLAWARRLQAIAQTGLHFEKDVFDGERYREIARIAAEIIAGHSAAEAAFVERFFEAEVGYATPKLDLRAAVFRDGGILLVREKSDGLWALPGGWADVGETPRQGVEKEVLEEAGLTVRAVKLLALYDQRGRGAQPHPLHILKAFFRCEIVGGGAAGRRPGARSAARPGDPGGRLLRRGRPAAALARPHHPGPARPPLRPRPRPRPAGGFRLAAAAPRRPQMPASARFGDLHGARSWATQPAFRPLVPFV